MEGFYSQDELSIFGFISVGSNVLISKKTSIYGASKMIIGDNVRIDDFALLIGNIELHNYIHIGAYCGLHASQDGKIVFEDFSGISSNVNIYASSDAFDCEFCTARLGLPEECIHSICTEVRLGKYSQIGVGSTVIPGGSLGEGVAVGAMSLVNRHLESWGIYFGIPCRFHKKRSNVLTSKLSNYLYGESSR